MLNRRTPLWIALLLGGGLVAWAVVHLFALRFSAGDVYPPYSSLRADPVGCKAFYDALHQLGSEQTHRNFKNASHLPEGRGAALFVFGVPVTELDVEEQELRALDAFVRNGGRLVITLSPQFTRPRAWNTPGRTNLVVRKKAGEEVVPRIPLGSKWDFGVGLVEIKRDRKFSYNPVAVTSLTPELPAAPSWHSALVLTNLGLDWKPIYARGTDPVMAERRLGAGTIVLATDSYFVSNEALQKERTPALLAWLCGGERTIYFDEVHLGVQEQPGVAALARRYNLHGAAAALVILAILFIWKNAVSFVPTQMNAAEASEVRGRASGAAFVNLLRRSVHPDALLQTCLTEWHKTRQLDGRASPRKRANVGKAVEAHNSDPKANRVDTYNSIVSILNEK